MTFSILFLTFYVVKGKGILVTSYEGSLEDVDAIYSTSVLEKVERILLAVLTLGKASVLILKEAELTPGPVGHEGEKKISTPPPPGIEPRQEGGRDK